MSSSSNTTTNVINPKPCNYNCGTRIYWNNQENAYFEVFTKQKHVCPNRTTKKLSIKPPSTAAKPIYYNKKDFLIKQHQTKDG
jgi:hypothetical protein